MSQRKDVLKLILERGYTPSFNAIAAAAVSADSFFFPAPSLTIQAAGVALAHVFSNTTTNNSYLVLTTTYCNDLVIVTLLLKNYVQLRGFNLLLTFFAYGPNIA
jgi:hypothetical protein